MIGLARLFKRSGSGRAPMEYEKAKRLAGDKSPKRRRALAGRDDLQPEILYFLAEDSDAEVRRAIAENEKTPTPADLILARDSDDEVRATMAHKIARLAPNLAPAAQEQANQAVFEVLQVLARDELPRIRRIIAEALKRAPNVPADVVQRLARDPDILVARPMLEFSPLLSDEMILEIIRSQPVQGAIEAISGRDGLGEDISDAIVAVDDEAAITALLSNTSAQIREETLDSLVDRAVDVPGWHGPLVRRPKLSPRAIAGLAEFVADTLLHELQRRDDIDPATAKVVGAAVRTRIREDGGTAAETGTTDSGEVLTPEERAEQLARDGALDEDVIVDALGKGDRAFAAAGLAALARVPLEAVQQAVSMESTKGLTAFAWKAGLKMRTAVELQLRLARIAPSEVLRAKEGTDYPMSQEDMRWQLEFFGVRG